MLQKTNIEVFAIFDLNSDHIEFKFYLEDSCMLLL